jgi:hypothetical protein
MNCSTEFMAKNLNALKISEVNRNGTPIAHKQPVAPLYLAQTRANNPKPAAPRQRLHVAIERDIKSEAPQPIKITHAG